MRLATKTSRTGALLVLPLALALGCGPKDDSKKTAVDDYKDVSVTVTLDGALSPKPLPDPVPLSKKDLHRARWDYCGKGVMDIRMKDEGDNPFDPVWERWVERGCQHFRSPKIKKDAREKKGYHYTISVLIGNEIHINDPDIDIMQ
jgi:hypothetical protein